MVRPLKIKEESKNYTFLISLNHFERLDKLATEMQKKAFEQVAVADLIRDAIEIYLEAVEGDEDDEE